MKNEINSASDKPTSDTVDTGTTGEDIGTGANVKTRQFQSELLQQRNQQLKIVSIYVIVSCHLEEEYVIFCSE